MYISLQNEKGQRRHRRIVAYIIGCGPKGASRSELIRRYNLSAQDLDITVADLAQRKGFSEHLGVGAGRPAQHYTYQPIAANAEGEGESACAWCTSPCDFNSLGVLSAVGAAYCCVECQDIAEGDDLSPLRVMLDRAAVPDKLTVLMHLAAAALVSQGWAIVWPLRPIYSDAHFHITSGLQICPVQVRAAATKNEIVKRHPDLVLVTVFVNGRITCEGLPDAEATSVVPAKK